jgi:tRNA threonylcarbamoyl adenosine modification protein YeaZ
LITPANMTQYGLALHSSTPELGLALGDSTQPTADRVATWVLGRETSNVLQRYLGDFVEPQDWGDLAWVAAGIGPGGFTGTRLAVVTARTLGQQLQIPVYGIDNLAVIAWQAQVFDRPIAVVMPAQRQEVFVGVYRVAGKSRQLEVMQAPQVLARAAQEQFLGSFTGQVLSIAPGENLGYTVAALWQLAQQRWQNGEAGPWQAALPFYGQNPTTIPGA